MNRLRACAYVGLLAWLPATGWTADRWEASNLGNDDSYYTKNELSRLYRDVVAGLFQPSDQESLHGAWAGAMLGPVTD